MSARAMVDGKQVRRDMGKEYRCMSLVTDPETADWIRKTAKGRKMTIAAFLDQIVQRARMNPDPLA